MELDLQQELLRFLQLIRRLNPAQLRSLCRFVHSESQEKFLSLQLEAVISKLGVEQIENIIAVTQSQDTETRLREINSLAQILNVDAGQLMAIGPLYRLQQLQAMLSALSIIQLMKIFEVVPPGPQIQKLQLLQNIQQLLGQLQPETLQMLHMEIVDHPQNPEAQQSILVQQLQLAPEQFHLYQPLRNLFQLEAEELLRFQEVMPNFHSIQMLQLLQLLQMQAIDVVELRRLLVEEAEVDQVKEVSAAVQIPEKTLKLKMVEQPPEQCIYKRNVKPNPTVMLIGDQSQNDGNIYVVPSILRCDTMESEPKFLSGNTPVQVASGRVVTFRKLKIMVTSHQQNETLFILKFELRKYNGNDYVVLHQLHSNPICVLSHSTQLKPAASTAPVVQEIIYMKGPTTGGTRVAVLGSNFNDSPSTRIRFGNIDVMPIFHGPGTLICSTPPHPAGTVEVRVCNDPRRWSDTFASFTYEPVPLPPDPDKGFGLAKTINLDIVGAIAEVAWEGGYEVLAQQENLRPPNLASNQQPGRVAWR